MFDHGNSPLRIARSTIGAIVAALMLLAACDPRRAIGDNRLESPAATFDVVA
jgi:hypothetical protein